MPRTGRVLWLLACAACAAAAVQSLAAAPEYNPVRRAPIAIGPEARRLIVGMRATPTNAVTKMIVVARRARSYTVTQAQTTSADVKALAQRVGLSLAKSRQFTPSMHVLFLQKTLYGADVEAVLEKLRADPAVQFAAVDRLRYPLAAPTNPLYLPTPGAASGQWYMNTPGPATVEGVSTTDASATDAVSAWGITTGSAGVVIADVDTGILFDHPDLLRAGLGGRLLPGYDFVGQDYNATTGAPLGTYLHANDGDGWDPDPSDPGDWISSADQQNSLFPASDCPADNSTWHGTRVVGVYGAITNNDVGTAGMTWGSASAPGPWVLPVRALGKCGGYDSDIIAGVQWAAGLPVTNPEGPAVPANPYPADIINLSLGGGTDACSSANGAAYQSGLSAVTAMDILIVISAGNGGTPGTTAPVELPANCSAVVPGVIAVAGLRNVGTKVGYSSFGAEVTVSAPAGNCINSSGACLRSIDTTTNLGLTVPAASGYTNETNPNLGTSFSAPIVSGIAGLMRSVNGNLTPTQLTARLKSSATRPFPTGAAGVPTCPSNDPNSGECACPNDGSQCGAGMVNAYHAVQAAQLPIAAVRLPPILAGSDAVLDASGSAGSCGRTISAYSWTATGGVSIVSGNSSDKATILPGAGTVTLTVTDNMGGKDTATITVTSNSASSSAPASAGNTACPTALQVTPVPPTIGQAFSPSTVGPTIPSTLTFTLRNANAFTLTQSNFSDALPAGLVIANSAAAASTCTGANGSLTNTSNSIALTGANIPPNGSCTVTLSVSSAAAGSYTNAVAANALMTGPAGGNASASQAMLTVTTPNPPTVSEAFAPASVGQNGSSTLTITLGNSNAYALTSVGLKATLPSNLMVKSSPAAASGCGGTLSAPPSSVTLSGATIPANGSCTLSLTVSSATVGTYANSIAASAVTSTPAGGNTAPASATLTVTASSGGGGGALEWPDVLVLAGVLLVARGRSRGMLLSRTTARRRAQR